MTRHNAMVRRGRLKSRPRALRRTNREARATPRIACYTAYANADYAQAQTALEAETAATTRALDLTSLWSQYVLGKTWTYDTVKFGGYDSLTYSMVTPDNNNLTYASFTGGAVTTMPTATSVDAVASALVGSGAPSNIGGVALYCDALMWQGYSPSTLWTALNDLNTATQGLQVTNAQLAGEASKKSAASQYVATYAALYGAEAAASLTAASAALAAELVAEQTLNTAMWNASETAHNATLNAVVASDDSSDVATYLNASVGASLNYAKSVASAYGTFQIDNRQTQYDNASANDPRKSLYAQGVSWATNTKSLRDQYYDVAGDAIEDYYTSITQAYTSYVSDVLSALTAAERSYFSAIKSYSINALAADAAYTSALFNAESTRLLAYVAAAIAEITGNYSVEATLAASRASECALAWEDAEEILQATQFSQGRCLEAYFLFNATSTEQTAYFDEIVDAAEQIVATKNAADSAAATATSQNASALASAKAANEATYTAATENAELAYTIAVKNAWNTAYMAQLGVAGTLKDVFEIANTTLKNGIDASKSNYQATAFDGYDDFEAEFGEISAILSYNQSRINSGKTIGSDVFENPTFDFEVCFAAGTLVLMADVSKKPIEEIQPGDMVFAADHLNPEETPELARVVRTFDNGLKEVVRLRFAKGGVEEEIVCTPSHRFYIIGRGWVCASEIVVGEMGVSADGKQVSFWGMEILEETTRVYNIEVGEKHSYFVGNTCMVLSHNECEHCINGLVPVVKEKTLWFRKYETIEVEKCQYCSTKVFEPKDFARQYIPHQSSNNRTDISSYEFRYIYEEGCVGVAMLSLKKWLDDEGALHPPFWEDATMFLSYESAREYYTSLVEQGNKPVLMAVVDNGSIRIKNRDIIVDAKTPLTTNDVELPYRGYDYLTLALINTGNGELPSWLHATGGKNSKSFKILVTPINGLHETRSAVYIVIKNSGRKGLNYRLLFDIPFIPENLLPPIPTLVY